jgi:hypothetical protein
MVLKQGEEMGRKGVSKRKPKKTSPGVNDNNNRS